MFGGKVPIQRCLIVPQFPDVNESRIKNIFCVEIFFAAILCTTGRNHLRHGRTGILQIPGRQADCSDNQQHAGLTRRSEEHTSELQSLMRISYAVFCLKKKKETITLHTSHE